MSSQKHYDHQIKSGRDCVGATLILMAQLKLLSSTTNSGIETDIIDPIDNEPMIQLQVMVFVQVTQVCGPTG